MKVAIHVIIMKMVSSIIASFLCSRCHEGDLGGGPLWTSVCFCGKRRKHISLALTLILIWEWTESRFAFRCVRSSLPPPCSLPFCSLLILQSQHFRHPFQQGREMRPSFINCFEFYKVAFVLFCLYLSPDSLGNLSMPLGESVFKKTQLHGM